VREARDTVMPAISPAGNRGVWGRAVRWCRRCGLAIVRAREPASGAAHGPDLPPLHAIPMVRVSVASDSTTRASNDELPTTTARKSSCEHWREDEGRCGAVKEAWAVIEAVDGSKPCSSSPQAYG
jgi:hypothetical protein